MIPALKQEAPADSCWNSIDSILQQVCACWQRALRWRWSRAQQSLCTLSPARFSVNTTILSPSSAAPSELALWPDPAFYPSFGLQVFLKPFAPPESFQNQTSPPLSPLPWLQFVCSPWNQFIRALTDLSQMGSDSSEAVEEAGLSSLSSLACWQCRGLEDAPDTLNHHHPCSTDAEAIHKRWPLKPCWDRRRFPSCWMQEVIFEKQHWQSAK